VKGNALILLSNGKIQPNTSRNPDEQGKKSLVIYLVGSGQCILGRKGDDFTDEYETSSMDKGMGGKTHDPLQYLITPAKLTHIYIYCTRLINGKHWLLAFCFKSLHHPSCRHATQVCF